MRTPVTLKIKFKSANIDQFIERYSVDVSRGGIFIRTKEPLPVGTQLKFEFQLQDAQPLISGEGTVVWIREHDPTRTGVAPGMGVRFDRLALQSQQVLDRILAEKQRLDAKLDAHFDAPTRSVVSPYSAQASGAIDQRARPAGRLQSDRTPLPDPSPFGGGDSKPGDDPGGFGASESTRVMLPHQAEELALKTRAPVGGTPAPQTNLQRPVLTPGARPAAGSGARHLPGKPVIATAPPGGPEPPPSGLTVTLQPPPVAGHSVADAKSGSPPEASHGVSADGMAFAAAPSPSEPARREPTLSYLPKVS